ncbi:DNA polymerase zeta processivity subunit [Cytospora mali]|uniref:DNA polymerase zeta processivity subunit n=1 Tax=Cytospora mali TaxID=578113 RepID=A0A194VI45_CYTMA|nr:DNA polymerase zeta processivity subunit [Valsa mali]
MSMPPPPLPGAAAEQPPPQVTQVPIAEARILFSSFTSFLTVSIHTILYYRGIYPKQTFLSAKAFNLPVHQSRHPKVCSWINDAVDAVMAQIAQGRVERVAVVIHAPMAPSSLQLSSAQQLTPGSILERWMFDVSHFPAWPGGIEALNNFRGEGGGNEQNDEDGPEDEDGSGDDNTKDATDDGGPAENDLTSAINWTDVDEQLRGAVRRLAYAGEKMEPFPEGCTFTVAVELRDEAQTPIGHPQPWIPSQPGLQPASRGRSQKGHDVGGVKTTPIRAIEAGPLFFECWVEEGEAKDAIRASQAQSSNPAL